MTLCRSECCGGKHKTEAGAFVMRVCGGFTMEVTPEQRLEGSEGVIHGTIQGKSPPGRAPQGGTCLEWTRKSKEAGVARQV